jgi:putative ABC transport system permease protein
LLSLLIASVGVAQIASAWIAQAAPQTAILRCLGLRPREVVLLYLGHVLLLALIGSVLGGVLGATLPSLVLAAYPELGPAELVGAVPLAAIARGIVLGVGVAMVFSIPPLTAVWQVSPASVLRAEVAPLPVPRAVRAASFVTLALGIVLAALAQTRDLVLALSFAAGVSALAALLWLCARGLLRGVGRIPRARLPVLSRKVPLRLRGLRPARPAASLRWAWARWWCSGSRSSKACSCARSRARCPKTRRASF